MDKSYWESFYVRQNAELKPSLFAKFVAENFSTEGKSLVELGCGNGRDAIYFGNEGLNVLAIDQCESEIKFLSNRYKKLTNIRFVCADFTNMDNSESFDIIYSRFTLHSISAEEEMKVSLWAYANLNSSGRFCIEVRGQKNEIFRKGEPVVGEKDAFIYNDHYRRFLNFEDFCNTLKNIGFEIEFAKEEKDFAPFNGENETYIRVIARKI